METASWLIVVGVVAVVALGVGALIGVVWMVKDTDEMVRNIDADRQRLIEANRLLSARLETYRADAAKELEPPRPAASP